MRFQSQAMIREDFATALLRASIILIFLWFGWMKFLAYEAEGVEQIAGNYWVFRWMYPILGVYGTSAVIGTLELATAVALILGWRWPLASILGGLMGCATFAVTLSFILVVPPETVWQSPPGFPALAGRGQFLIKDIVILAGCLLIARNGWVNFMGKNRI